jgi:hypothetical protein
MTQDEIIEMAKQTGLTSIDKKSAYLRDCLERFAKLVADKKHQELCRLAAEAPVRGDARETRQNILHAIRGEA